MRFDYSRDTSRPALILSVMVSPMDAEDGIEAPAKIDTGASRSIIPESLRSKLQLPVRGAVSLRGILGGPSRPLPTHEVRLSIDHSFSFPLEVVSIPLANFLIGRDLLNQLVLTANGPEEFFKLHR